MVSGADAVDRGGRIVVAGEALVDLVVGAGDAGAGDAGAGGELRAHPGGGPFNTARTIARLEQPAAFLGCLSTDPFGERLRRALADDGVSLEAAVSVDLPTTLAVAAVGDDGAARYVFYVADTSAPALTEKAALAALPERVDALHVGTLGLVLEPMAAALEAMVAWVGGLGETLVMVDPNCRPSLIRDPGPYRRRLRRVLGSSHVVRASGDDLRWLEPEAAPIEAARTLLGCGPRVALVTCGGDGAVVVTGDTSVPVAAVPADVVDTIGAGDAFGGAFLAWWRRQNLGPGDLDDLEAVTAAVRFACVVAARTCERAGASPPTLAELESG